MNCSAQACIDVCDLACSSAVGCPGGALVDEDINHFASDKGMNALKAVHITTATLSVLGSLFIMVTYHLIPTHCGASLRIVYWLSVSDLVTSLVYIVDGFTSANEDGSPRCPNGLCVLLAATAQLFGLSAIMWNTYIALNMHLAVLLTARIVRDEPRYMRRLHVVAWGVAILSTLITGAAGGLGSAGQWCWIRGGDFAWAQLLFFYLPVVLSLGYSLGVYLCVRQRIVRLRRHASMAQAGSPSDPSSTLQELMHRFVSFLIVYGLIHSFRVANRLQAFVTPDRPSYALWMLHSVFGPTQGLGNALVYGWTPRVRRLYAHRFPRWCACLAVRHVPAEHAPPGLATGESAGSAPAGPADGDGKGTELQLRRDMSTSI